MALTDADRLQMTAMALMRYSVVTSDSSAGTGISYFTLLSVDDLIIGEVTAV